jgi:ubiquinone/menaquinone biosynthesis C-methylase UbiE
MKKRGVFSRSRGVDEFNKRFKSMDLVPRISEISLQKKNLRLLEIGCGEGRLLMELAKHFPDAQLEGVNKEPWIAMRGRQSLKKTALFYHIFSASELKRVHFPSIHFCDAKKLPFPSNHFDFVVSQVTFPHIERKDRAIEEVWRVLKKGGVGWINFDYYNNSYPPSLQPPTPRMVIWNGKRKQSLQFIIQSKRAEGYHIRLEVLRKGTTILSNLVMRKNTSKPLCLDLSYDTSSSISLSKMARNGNFDPIFWGHQSVFNIKN